MNKNLVVGSAASFVIGTIGMNSSAVRGHPSIIIISGAIMLISLVAFVTGLLSRSKATIPTNNAANDEESLLLKVHKSNLKSKGFIAGKGWWIWHGDDD